MAISDTSPTRRITILFYDFFFFSIILYYGHFVSLVKIVVFLAGILYIKVTSIFQQAINVPVAKARRFQNYCNNIIDMVMTFGHAFVPLRNANAKSIARERAPTVDDHCPHPPNWGNHFNPYLWKMNIYENLLQYFDCFYSIIASHIEATTKTSENIYISVISLRFEYHLFDSDRKEINRHINICCI